LDQEGHKAEALHHFRESYRWNDKQRGGRFHAGRILLELGHGDEAEREFLPLIVPAPDQSKMLRNIAKCYHDVDRLDLGRKLAVRANMIVAGQHYKSLETEMRFFRNSLQ
jgi:predicted Zn-dependent protease